MKNVYGSSPLRVGDCPVLAAGSPVMPLCRGGTNDFTAIGGLDVTNVRANKSPQGQGGNDRNAKAVKTVLSPGVSKTGCNVTRTQASLTLKLG